MGRGRRGKERGRSENGERITNEIKGKRIAMLGTEGSRWSDTGGRRSEAVTKVI